MDTLFGTPYTIPDEALVTHDDRDSWIIDFTLKMGEDEFIVTNSVFIEEVSPYQIDPIDGFVTSVDIVSGKMLSIFWDASPLVSGHVYLLHSIVTLNTTINKSLLTFVKCVG